jgi:hypothetical protein
VAHVKWALQPIFAQNENIHNPFNNRKCGSCEVQPIFAQNIHNPFQNSPKHMLSLEHVLLVLFWSG